MKKSLWIIVLLVIVSILLSLRVFTPLTKADDSLLSQVVKKTQLNPETSDDFMEVVLAQERHFVEVSFIVVTVFMVVLFGSFAFFNYQGTRSQLRGIEDKLRKEYEEKFGSLEDEILLASANGLNFQTIILERFSPVSAIGMHFNILNYLIECSKETEEVQEGINSSLNEIIRLAKSSVEKFPEDIKKRTKGTLDKLSKHPFLKEKVEEIKRELK